ncbi:MAG: type II toxin-antitoxin system VapC family toxin [Deltaproteobacteria bacterium]|nr:type II toxin-antitoxin system VapC family toxin [Deltaproteobacteria bacterium]
MLHEEAGGEKVEPLLAAAVISSVNWSEVVQKSIARNVWDESIRADLEALGLSILPFTREDAEGAARLWQRTRTRGLSLGDRACLALGLRLGLPVVTTDRAWRGAVPGLDVRVVR